MIKVYVKRFNLVPEFRPEVRLVGFRVVNEDTGLDAYFENSVPLSDTAQLPYADTLTLAWNLDKKAQSAAIQKVSAQLPVIGSIFLPPQ